MNSFKDIAYKILKKSNKPLHSRKITEIALKKRLLRTDGKTPWATMNSALQMDVNQKGSKSNFVKAGPSLYGLNPAYKLRKADEKPIRVPLKEEFVKHAIIRYLSTLGWGHFEYGDLHTRGVDLRAKRLRYSRYLYLEAKGSSQLIQSDETGFIYSLGQIVTRMKDSGSTRNYYGIGLPDSAARIALRRLPWQVSKKLLLTIYSVNSLEEVEEFSWSELKKLQTAKP